MKETILTPPSLPVTIQEKPSNVKLFALKINLQIQSKKYINKLTLSAHEQMLQNRFDKSVYALLLGIIVYKSKKLNFYRLLTFQCASLISYDTDEQNSRKHKTNLITLTYNSCPIFKPFVCFSFAFRLHCNYISVHLQIYTTLCAPF